MRCISLGDSSKWVGWWETLADMSCLLFRSCRLILFCDDLFCISSDHPNAETAILSCGSREFSDGFWQFAETRSRLCGILLASSSETGAVVRFENYIWSLLVQMSVLPSIWKIIHQDCNWEGASGKIYIFDPSDYFHVRALSEGCPHSTLPSPVCHVLPPVSNHTPLVSLPVPPLNTTQHSEMNATHCAWSLFWVTGPRTSPASVWLTASRLSSARNQSTRQTRHLCRLCQRFGWLQLSCFWHKLQLHQTLM